jgi:2-dehydro-3-deoxyglucarate aldolase
MSIGKKSFFDQVSVGSWIQIGHPAVAEIMASAGFDWLAIDLEHSAITLREAEDLIRIIDLKGVIPFVRLSSVNEEQIKRVMDAGAVGIIAPMVTCAEEAQRVVDSSKYPPEGSRSIGLARAQGYGARFDEYFERQKDELITVVQIEHVDAVENLEEIFMVPGVDAYIVGPYDLSGSIGKPGQFEDPEFLQLVRKIRTVAQDLKMPGGVHLVEPDPETLRHSIEEGNRFIAYGVDTRMLDTCCRESVSVWKGVTG